MNTYHVYAICWKRILVKTERQGICYLCEEQGWARGSFVEAEAEVEAEARQRQRARGRGEADKTRGKAEARQSEIDVVCVILISCTMHM